jgi:hypothetical protein
MWIGARGADGSGRGPISMFAKLTHRQLLRLVPVAKVTDHFHTDWYRNRAALRQGLSILAGIFFVERVATDFRRGFATVPRSVR